jgi:diguanylate cyclase (GGDEF)-like protein/PAS domain S-box-containing protein
MSKVRERERGVWLRRGVATATTLVAMLMLVAAAAFAAVSPASGGARADTVERHPLELRALSEPEAVLSELVPALRDAHIAGDQHQIALLFLAKANACRVMADWNCQREAGEKAGSAAQAAGLPQLQARGLIAESRARMALQDYTRSDRLLGEAEQLLKATPQPELLADVMLAYSSMSYSLGKHALGARYAERGLALLGPGEGLTMQARLQRNRARALAQLGRTQEAARALELATGLAEQLNDPKLVAELYLEAARLARIAGDIPTQRVHGERILTLANQLKNSQLDGLGHEVMGLAAIDNHEGAIAVRELQAAQASFRALDLGNDELRVLREMVQFLLRSDPSSPLLGPMFERFLLLDASQADNERSQAADDFDARLKYAERETEVLRLQNESAMAAQRELALAERNRLSVIVSILAFAMLVALAVFFAMQRRGNRRLREAMAQLGERELQYRTLAENASDLVVRMRLDGKRVYVSPSSRELLGYEPGELADPRWEMVHADDRERLADSLREVIRDGGPVTIAYRLMHRNGHHVWIEALARRVLGPDGQPEVVYAGRDVSARIRIERKLAAAQAQLRAVADNIPAMIARIDSQQRYTFVNGFSTSVFAGSEADTLGRTIRDVRGEALYSEIRPHIEAALRGERVNFEGQATIGGKRYDYQTNYVPDIGADGLVQGFFSFTFDITRLKEAERELERQARVDGLTGLANRRHFDERLAAASARSRRAGQPLALLYLDVDHFKEINDGHGHVAGDDVLREFARRLKANVREGDLVARIGGDEFVVLIEGPESLAGVEAVAGKLVQALHEPVPLAAGLLAVGTSVGVGFSRSAATGDRLLAAADQALYAAKDGGRGCWRTVAID